MSKQGNRFFTGQGLYGSPLPSGLNNIQYPENPEFKTEKTNLIDSGIIPWEPGSSKNAEIQGDWPTILFLDRRGIMENSPDGTKVGKVTTNLFNGLITSYTLTDDAGGRFELIGDIIKVKDGSLLNNSINVSHKITIKATNPDNGKGVSRDFTILVHFTCNDFESANALDWFNRGSTDAVPEIVANPGGSGNVMSLYSIEPHTSVGKGEAVIKSDFGCLATPRFEFKVRFKTVDNDNSAAFWAGDDTLGHGVSGRTANVYLEMKRDKFLWFSDLQGFNEISGITVVPNQWYTFLIDNLNPGAFTYDITIDGVFKDTADYRNHDAIIVNWFTCFQVSLNQTWWDDVCCYPI